ncbi:hypothetical protein ACQ4LE_000511 [Meloidogyne hapla]
MFNLIDILFKFDYWASLLIGYPLNIILIILIIFKTPQEMKTHSRILIQNCVLDILLLTVHMFVQMFYITDNGNSFIIFTDGILFKFMKENFDHFFAYNLEMIWQYLYSLNLHGLCVQFIYRYLILNRNMNICYRQYFCMFLTALFVGLMRISVIIFFAMQYSGGGIKQFDEVINETIPFVQNNMVTVIFIKFNIQIVRLKTLSIFPIALNEIISYLIIFICSFKMVKYVNLYTGFDANMKILVKQLTKTLIILAFIPFINQIANSILIVNYNTSNKTINIIRFLICCFFHFTPVFNPLVCILTTKPYREAVFNRLRIHPQ